MLFFTPSQRCDNFPLIQFQTMASPILSQNPAWVLDQQH